MLTAPLLNSMTAESLAVNSTNNIDEPILNDSSNAATSKLNGAQIASLLNIIQSYKDGAISRGAAISIVVSTLGVSQQSAETFIEEPIKMRI